MFALFPGGIVKCVGRLERSASPSGCFGLLSSSSSSTPASLPPSTTTNPSGLTTSRSTPISSLSASSPARCCWRCTLLAFPATWCPCSTGNVLNVHQRFIFCPGLTLWLWSAQLWSLSWSTRNWCPPSVSQCSDVSDFSGLSKWLGEFCSFTLHNISSPCHSASPTPPLPFGLSTLWFQILGLHG